MPTLDMSPEGCSMCTDWDLFSSTAQMCQADASSVRFGMTQVFEVVSRVNDFVYL